MIRKITKTNEEWQKELSSEQYRVTRLKGTEAPFSGEYCHTMDKGIYRCSNCGLELFSSERKYDSSSGWPSFDAPVAEDHIDKISDRSLGMERTEVVCQRCGAHLGHVFDDGPATTGQRFCMNSVALKLAKDKRDQK